MKRRAESCSNCLYSKNHLGTKSEGRKLRKILASGDRIFHCHEYGPWRLEEKSENGVVCAAFARKNNLALKITNIPPPYAVRFAKMSDREKFSGDRALF